MAPVDADSGDTMFYLVVLVISLLALPAVSLVSWLARQLRTRIRARTSGLPRVGGTVG